MWFILLASCSGDPAVTTDSGDTELVGLEAPALLRRISLDLRGVVPTPDEITAVTADPGELDGVVDEYLASPEFSSRLVNIFAEQWLTLVDEFNVPASDFLMDDEEYDFLRSVGQEPLRLMAYVGSHDLPWTETVTADYTIANDVLTGIWPMAYEDPDAPEDWKKAQYTDGRPANGVLATNGMWWRYDTTRNNYNRGRAAAMSRLLLCHDFLQRPVEFTGITEFSSDALLAATRTNPSCVSCHSAVDPLAATMFGYYWYDDKDATEMSYYHPEREPLGALYLNLVPSWYGTPLDGSASLGQMAASDNRFSRCAASRMATALWRRDALDDDYDTITALDEDFQAGDLRLTALIRAVVATPEYRAGALDSDNPSDNAARAQTMRVMAVDQIASAVEGLTGYRWSWEGWDQLDNDTLGYRVMAGGVDGDVVTHVSLAPSVTRSLVIRRLSQLAAAHVVAHDMAADPSDRTLLGPDIADLSAVSADDDALSDELIALHMRIHGAAPDDALLAADLALWSQVDALGGPAAAWSSVVSGMIRDPLFWSY